MYLEYMEKIHSNVVKTIEQRQALDDDLTEKIRINATGSNIREGSYGKKKDIHSLFFFDLLVINLQINYKIVKIKIQKNKEMRKEINNQ